MVKIWCEQFSWVCLQEWNCWIFEKLSNHFPQWFPHFTFPSEMYEIWNLPTSPVTLIVLFFVLFFIISNIVVVKWYFIMALICISVMNNNVETFFMFLFSICIYCLEKCLFRSLADFLIGLFLLLSFNCSLYNLYIYQLYKTNIHIYMYPHIFSHSVDCALTFFIVSFDTQKRIMMKSNLLIFFLLLHMLWVSYLRNCCLIQSHNICTYVFF